MREGTLKELNVKVGDKIRVHKVGSELITGTWLVVTSVDHERGSYLANYWGEPSKGGNWEIANTYIYQLEGEAVTEEIKVGDEVEVQFTKEGEWWNDGHTVSAVVGDYYILTVGKVAPIVAHVSTVRKPNPVVTEVVMYGNANYGSWSCGMSLANVDTHKITFNLVDGEPDCNSIKMEKL